MIDGPLIAFKYRVFQILSVGGMGRLWLARDEQDGTTVVIKRPGDWHDEKGKTHRRFEIEARAAASLSSRHIVRVLEYGVDDAGPFLVMEYLIGHDLSELLAKHGPWAPERVLWALEQIDVALHLAHRRGIVHRDLKPSNLFCAEEGGASLIKVLDFGIAKAVGPDWFSTQLTADGTLVGSNGYMSPEQSRGKPVDRRSDLWSLAAILYELLTGVPTFAARHPGETLARLCEGAYTPITRIAPSLSAAYDEFFDRAFQLDPQHRYQDVRQLTAAFRLAVSSGVPSQVPLTKTMRSRDEERPKTLRMVTPASQETAPPPGRFGRAQATRTIVLDAPARNEEPTREERIPPEK